MEIETIDRLVDRLVRAAESEQVRRQDAVSGADKNRNHSSIEIRPCGLAMQTQEDVFRIRWAFIYPSMRNPENRGSDSEKCGANGKAGRSENRTSGVLKISICRTSRASGEPVCSAQSPMGIPD